jgi:hypothetical protein
MAKVGLDAIGTSTECDRSIPILLCREWPMLSDLAHVATGDWKRFRGQVLLMDRIPDTTQPAHA